MEETQKYKAHKSRDKIVPYTQPANPRSPRNRATRTLPGGLAQRDRRHLTASHVLLRRRRRCQPERRPGKHDAFTHTLRAAHNVCHCAHGLALCGAARFEMTQGKVSRDSSPHAPSRPSPSQGDAPQANVDSAQPSRRVHATGTDTWLAPTYREDHGVYAF